MTGRIGLGGSGAGIVSATAPASTPPWIRAETSVVGTARRAAPGL
jgi:hypothetical protein